MRNLIVSIIFGVLFFLLITSCISCIQETVAPNTTSQPTPTLNGSQAGDNTQINDNNCGEDDEYGVDEYGRPRNKRDKNHRRFPHLFPRRR